MGWTAIDKQTGKATIIGSGAATQAITFPSRPTAGSTIFVIFWGFNNGAIFNLSGITDNAGNTYVKQLNEDAAFEYACHIWMASDIVLPGGSTALTITASVSNNTNGYVMDWGAASFLGGGATPSLHVEQSTDTSSPHALAITTTVEGCLIFHVQQDGLSGSAGGTGSWATPSGYTNLIVDGVGGSVMGTANWKIAGPAGVEAVTAAFTGTDGGAYPGFLVSFAPTSAASAAEFTASGEFPTVYSPSGLSVAPVLGTLQGGAATAVFTRDQGGRALAGVTISAGPGGSFDVGTTDATGRAVFTADQVASQTTVPINASYTTAAGQLLTASSAVIIEPNDTTPPAVTLSLAPTSLTANGNVTATISATDANGVTSARLLKNGVQVGALLLGAGPWNIDVPLTAADNGTVTFIAKAYDRAGNEGQSASRTCTVAIYPVTPPPATLHLASPVPTGLTNGSGPFTLRILDQNNNPLPASPPCSVVISKPGYVDGPPFIANGKLTLDPRGKGTATVTVTYPIGNISITFTVTVGA